MTEKAHPSINRTADPFKTAVGFAEAGGSSDGFVVDGANPSELATQDSGIDETQLNAFAESHSASSYDVTIDPGEAYVYGSWIAKDTATTVTVDASTANQTIYVGWNKDSPDDVIIGLASAFEEAAGDTDMKFAIYDVDADGSGVTAVTDRRVVGKVLRTETVENQSYHEAVQTLGTVSGTTGVDLDVANLATATLGGDTTFEFLNPSADPPGNSFTLLITQDGSSQYAITWPSSVEWDSGSPPGDPATGEELEVSFVSYDGGTTWKGRESGRNFA